MISSCVSYFYSDGGVTWTQEVNGVSGFLNGVSFVDNNGIAVGDDGVIIKTTDGGINWTQKTSGTSGSLRKVSFSDVNTGTAVGQVILWTTDGGETWMQQTMIGPFCF